MGSASEFEYQVILARDLKMLNGSDYERLTDEVVGVKRMLSALLQKLKADS